MLEHNIIEHRAALNILCRS